MTVPDAALLSSADLALIGQTRCAAASVSETQRATLIGRRRRPSPAAVSFPEISHGVFRSASGCWLTFRKRATRSCEIILLDRDMARAHAQSPDVRRDYDRSPAALAASNAVGAPAFCSPFDQQQTRQTNAELRCGAVWWGWRRTGEQGRQSCQARREIANGKVLRGNPRHPPARATCGVLRYHCREFGSRASAFTVSRNRSAPP
jgi:hypothetical protein